MADKRLAQSAIGAAALQMLLPVAPLDENSLPKAATDQLGKFSEDCRRISFSGPNMTEEGYHSCALRALPSAVGGRFA